MNPPPSSPKSAARTSPSAATPPSRKATVPDQISAELRRRILGDAVRAGSPLAGERTLAEELGTNRNTLREALRRLESERLIAIRQGRPVIVHDFRRSLRLDGFGEFLANARDPAEAARAKSDLLDLRDALIAEARRFRARHDASDAVADRLRGLWTDASHAEGRARAEAEIAAFEAEIDASHSLSLRWLANGLVAALKAASSHA